MDHDDSAELGKADGMRRLKVCALVSILVTGAWLAKPVWARQAENPGAQQSLPEPPQPKTAARHQEEPLGPCQVRRASVASAWGAAAAAAEATGDAARAAATEGIGNPVAESTVQAIPEQAPCPAGLEPIVNWYARFLDGPQVKAMTPREKGWLAVRDVADPFNAITILGSSAIAVGSNAYSPYGPGMSGFGRYVGVSYAQDMTGEFFGTFLIPSIVRQDPHYHRMPDTSLRRRIAHAVTQVVWTQGDNGGRMLNYANLLGFALDDEIGNLYVPGQQTNLPASAERYAIGLATAPIENFVTEFLPDVARRIHVRVVLIQRIINQVARTDASVAQP